MLDLEAKEAEKVSCEVQEVSEPISSSSIGNAFFKSDLGSNSHVSVLDKRSVDSELDGHAINHAGADAGESTSVTRADRAELPARFLSPYSPSPQRIPQSIRVSSFHTSSVSFDSPFKTPFVSAASFTSNPSNFSSEYPAGVTSGSRLSLAKSDVIVAVKKSGTGPTPAWKKLNDARNSLVGCNADAKSPNSSGLTTDGVGGYGRPEDGIHEAYPTKDCSSEPRRISATSAAFGDGRPAGQHSFKQPSGTSTRRTLSIPEAWGHRRSAGSGTTTSDGLPARRHSDLKAESFYNQSGGRVNIDLSAAEIHAGIRPAPPKPDAEPRETPRRWSCLNPVSRARGSCLPAVFSALCATVLPVGCLVCNAPWLIGSERGPVGKAGLVLYCYLVGIMLSSMWKAATSDPGILPRHLDPHPEIDCDQPLTHAQKQLIFKDSQSISKIRIQARWVSIGNYMVPTKWCRRCKTYRPPRASHCRTCDSCVEFSDHHCTFLNNCIGRKNYFTFLVFLITTTIVMLTTISISLVHLVFIAKDNTQPEAIGNYIVVGSAFILGSPVLGLLLFHAKLISSNMTTMERIRPILIQNHLDIPPTSDVKIYSLGNWYSNWLWVFCRPSFGLARIDPMDG